MSHITVSLRCRCRTCFPACGSTGGVGIDHHRLRYGNNDPGVCRELCASATWCFSGGCPHEIIHARRAALGGKAMEGNEKPLYRQGRLVIPPGIRDQGPSQVAAWLGCVPVADRARAFRALPLNLAAAAFLQMDPCVRVSLLAGLNPANIRYLMSITPDGQLLETLEVAGGEVHAAVMGSLPDWRYHRIEQVLAARQAALLIPEGAEKPATRRRSWWVRMLERFGADRP